MKLGSAKEFDFVAEHTILEPGGRSLLTVQADPSKGMSGDIRAMTHRINQLHKNHLKNRKNKEEEFAHQSKLESLALHLNENSDDFKLIHLVAPDGYVLSNKEFNGDVDKDETIVKSILTPVTRKVYVKTLDKEFDDITFYAQWFLEIKDGRASRKAKVEVHENKWNIDNDFDLMMAADAANRNKRDSDIDSACDDRSEGTNESESDDDDFKGDGFCSK
jgi:hypothetical protein